MYASLRRFYTMTVFVQCDEETRRKRLMKREGAKYIDFVRRWIPLEELYFRSEHIEEISDVIFMEK